MSAMYIFAIYTTVGHIAFVSFAVTNAYRQIPTPILAFNEQYIYIPWNKNTILRTVHCVTMIQYIFV